jgi:Zn-dependent protease with chaperone function
MVWAWKKLGLLAPAPDRLRAIVTKVSVAMNLPFRNVWLLHNRLGAYALPFTGELIFSERLLEKHPDAEVAAVCAHELGHLSESKWTLTKRLLGVIGFALPWLFVRPLVHTWGPAGVFLIVVASSIIVATSRLQSRTLEVRADAVARTNESEAGTYARALERLHQDCLVPAVMPRQTTHPDLYARLLSAGAQPGYPRPEKPESIAWHGYLLSLLAVILVVVNMMQFFHESK